jgi:pimeloyl-ACP methyl ester carboxylesterase
MYGKVCYVETREKPSSKVSYNADFSPSAVAADIARYIDETCSSQGYGLVASSTGANVAIESWQLLELKPEWMVLLLPHAKAPIPGYVSALKLIPDSMLPRLRRLLLSMAGKSLIPKKVAAQREGIIAALGTADLRKLRASATAWRGYVLDTASVRNIDTRTLVVGASSDRMHSTAGAQALLSQLPNGHWLDAVTFPSAHGSRAAEALLAWALEPQPRQRV